MNLETPVEYFYGDTLRWSFGFENPNKAAVIFACAVPLVWCLWQMAWKLKNHWWRIPALLTSAGALMGVWYCLIMTFSRGGLVAAAAALAYLFAHTLHRGGKPDLAWHQRSKVWLGVMLLVALTGGTVWSGLGARSTEALGNDASVGNRFDLWNGALQMAAENVRGFGAGKSGDQYMQWYQPLERHEGYRTMVNSYLTFLVERGWLWSVLILSAFVLFWVWTRPRKLEIFTVALRGVILAFLIAGIFSTTMEDWLLWILPAACGLVLVILTGCQRRGIERRHMLISVGLALTGCTVLFITGFLKSGKDQLKREFAAGALCAIGPKNPKTRSIGCLVDEAVLGNEYAKLLREMALKSDVKIYLGGQVNEADRILCCGKTVLECASYPGKPMLLLAPEKIEETVISSLAARAVPAWIILPEIDEDGRVSFWDEATEGALAANFKKSALSGVGTRVDWAWSQVMEIVKSE
ncbi:MAG: O-antigen ligase family protein [Luteolibacter sp.]